MQKSSTIDISSHLQKLYEQGRLAPFVVLQAFGPLAQTQLENSWPLSHFPADTPLNHPDVLILSALGQQYRLQDLDPLQNFLSHRPWRSKSKLVLFSMAQKLQSAQVANALLKTLEAPEVPCHFIFLSANPRALIPTLKSRAQIYTLDFVALKGQDDWHEDLDSVDFYATAQKYASSENELQQLKLCYQLAQKACRSSDFNLLQKTIESLKWWETSQNFHNPAVQRIFDLLINSSCSDET